MLGAHKIAEDIIFWVRGLDVRHGRAILPRIEKPVVSKEPEITENSQSFHSEVTPGR
jgi:hypothetical protein